MYGMASDDAGTQWTDRARWISELAWRQACSRGDGQIRPEHYLLALLDTEHCTGNLAVRVLEVLGVAVEQLREHVDARLSMSGSPHQRAIPHAPEASRAVQAAWTEAALGGHTWLGTEHLLLGICVEGGSPAAQALN